MDVPSAWVAFSVSVCRRLCLQAATGRIPILQSGWDSGCLLPHSPWALLASSSLQGQAESGAERLLANHRCAEKCVSKAGFIALAWHRHRALAGEQNSVAKRVWRNGPGFAPPYPSPPNVGCGALKGLGRLWGGAAHPAPPSPCPGLRTPVSRGVKLGCERGVKRGSSCVS